MKTWSTMEEYFRALERCLDCPGEDRERFLAQARERFLAQARRMADDFLQGKPDATPDEVAGCLGEPEELAQCFLEELDPEMLERRKRRRKLGRWVLAGVLAIVVVLLALWLIILKTTPSDVEVTERIIVVYDERNASK